MEYRVDVFEGTRDVNGRIKCRCGFSGLMLMKDFIRKNFHMQNEYIREYLCAACKNRITEVVTFDDPLEMEWRRMYETARERRWKEEECTASAKSVEKS